MSARKTALASTGVCALGTILLLALTKNFTAFTTEGQRRLTIATLHTTVPKVELETQHGKRITFDSLRGKWLLIDFIYTRCTTYCMALGSEFDQIYNSLEPLIAEGKVQLVSISFDPAIDTPTELSGYLNRFASDSKGWIAVRPTSAADLSALLSTFRVTVVPDQYDGFVHNTGIVVVNPSGRMEVVLNQGDPQAVVETVRKLTNQ